MIELEKLREEHAKKFAGLSHEEELRLRREESEETRKALKAMGIDLPRAERPAGNR